MIHPEEPRGNSEYLQGTDDKPDTLLSALVDHLSAPNIQSRGGVVTSAKKPVFLLRGLSKGYRTAVKETPRKLVSGTGLQFIKKETGIHLRQNI